MDRVSRWFLWLLIIGPIHMGEQLFTSIEEFHFDSAEAFLSAPLVRDFLLRDWLEPLADPATHESVLSSIAELIDGERHESDFSLSVKATIVIGQKAR